MFSCEIQSNLSIADMLYNGHLVIAETFWVPGEQFEQKLPVNSGDTIIGWGNRKHIDVIV